MFSSGNPRTPSRDDAGSRPPRRPPPPTPPSPSALPLSPLDLDSLRKLGVISSLAVGWSSFPCFSVLITIQMNVLYARICPYLASLETDAQSVVSFALLTVRILASIFFFRNTLALTWDFFVDSIREKPTLNPLLFRNFSEFTQVTGLARPHIYPTRLLLLMHFTAALVMATTASVVHHITDMELAPGCAVAPWLFWVNFAVKCLLFGALKPCFDEDLEEKEEDDEEEEQAKNEETKEADQLRRLPKQEGRGRRRRHRNSLSYLGQIFSAPLLSCAYTSFSDTIFFILMMMGNFRGLLPSHHAHPWLITDDRRKQILAFNFCFFVLTNLTSYGFFTSQIAAKGTKAIKEMRAWEETMRYTRNFSLAVVTVGWALSFNYTGLLPSLFSLSILLSCMSINRFVLFMVVEMLRTAMGVWANVKGVGKWMHRLAVGQNGGGGGGLKALIPYLWITLALVHIYRYYGLGGVWTCLGFVSFYFINFTYKYTVQTTRTRQSRNFFQHGMDLIAFGPLAFILFTAVLKISRCCAGMRHEGARAADALPSQLGATDAVDCGIITDTVCPPTAPPPSLFHIHHGEHSLNISSIMGTIELTYASDPSVASAAAAAAAVTPPPFAPHSAAAMAGIAAAATTTAGHVAGGLPPYSFCDFQLQGVCLLDYSLLSLLSYFETDTEEFVALFDHVRANDDWVLVGGSEDLERTETEEERGKEGKEGNGEGECQKTHNETMEKEKQKEEQENLTATGFIGAPRGHTLEFFSARRNVSVIAIRGTNPLKAYDVFQNILLYHPAFMFDLTAQVSPMLRWVPYMWTSYILYLSMLPSTFFAGKDHPHSFYHNELIEFVAKRAQKRNIVLAGHSLGGAVAKVVAAAVNVPVVAVSSPGVFLSSRGFGVDGEKLKFLEVNVYAEGDLVPKIDRLQGAAFQLACHASNPFMCHQPGQVICELLNRCGDSSSSGTNGERKTRPFKRCRFVT